MTRWASRLPKIVGRSSLRACVPFSEECFGYNIQPANKIFGNVNGEQKEMNHRGLDGLGEDEGHCMAL